MYNIKITQNTNPLLNQIIVSNKSLNFNSVIYPNLGAAIQELSINNDAIIDGITNCLYFLNWLVCSKVIKLTKC